MSGWLKLHRKIIEKAIWQDPQMLKLWLYCLIRANHTETEVLIEKQEIKLYPGQFVTGRFALADEYNRGAKKRHRVSPDTLWRWLKKFQEWEMLHIKSTNKYSVITIKNWDAYQQTAQEMHNNCTTDAQQMHTDKNDKNDKEMIDVDDERSITPLPHPEEEIGPNWEASWRVGAYFSQRCGRGSHVRESDRFEIEQLLDKGVTEREILFWIDECFKRKKGSTINSFRYIATVIEDERRKREQQKSNKVTPLRRRNQPKEDFSDLPKAIRRQMEREARGEDYESEEDPEVKAKIMEELNRMRRRFEEKRAGGQ